MIGQPSELRLNRLQEIVRLHEEKKEVLASIQMMRQWVLEAEAIFDGSWASGPEERSNDAVGERFDAYLVRLSHLVDGNERTEDEKMRLGHLLKVFTHMRPYLTQCYDREEFPRTNNEMEQTIHAVKARYRRISGRKGWNGYVLRYGRCIAYYEYWMKQLDGEFLLESRLRDVSTTAWQSTRQQTRQSHREQLNRSRFRRHPVEYLATLEKRWEQTLRT